MKTKILNILKNSADYISGESISKQLGISRAGVWKNINKLKSEGYKIDSVTNKGYKIISAPKLLSADGIQAGLKTEFIGKNIHFYLETDSTNTQSKLNSDSPDGSLFVTECQKGGKGRLGRAWTSPSGIGIWFTLLLKPNLTPPQVPMITLIAGLAVCRSICKLGLDARIKWPNDIVIGSKKVCGILTEMSAEMDRVNYVVCGIGINANTESFSEELQVKATSLMLEKGQKIDRCALLQDILYEFEQCYTEFLKNGFSSFKSEYKKYCVTLNRTVSIIQNNQSTVAEAIDITDDGELIVKIDGETKVVSSGEVSVRGLYGYI